MVVELKNATDENADIHAAFNQLQTYKQLIPSLFTTNAFLIASDGWFAKIGTISSDYPRFEDKMNNPTLVVITDRDALPNASFIGFTGTPIEKEDKNTQAVFGDYIDVYDIQQAVEDGATVRIYYDADDGKGVIKIIMTGSASDPLNWQEHIRNKPRRQVIGDRLKARFSKFDEQGKKRTDEEIETAIRQIVNDAIISKEVIDVFDAAGIKKPDISILSDEFLAAIQGMSRKNLALDFLLAFNNIEIKEIIL